MTMMKAPDAGAESFPITNRRGLRRVARTVAGTGVVLGSLTVGFGFGHVAASGGDEVAVIASPNSQHEVVVTAGANLIDPVWRVEVRSRSGWRPRERTVGCINGDAPWESFRSVRWRGNKTLVVTTRDDEALVGVDPTTGRPDPSSSSVWNWDCG